MEASNIDSSISLISRSTRLIFLVLYCLPIFVVPQFAEFFRSYGTELPLLTSFVVKNYFYSPVFYLFTELSFRLYSGKNGQNYWRLFRLNLLAAIFVLLAILICLYLPAFSNGGAV